MHRPTVALVTHDRGNRIADHVSRGEADLEWNTVRREHFLALDRQERRSAVENPDLGEGRQAHVGPRVDESAEAALPVAQPPLVVVDCHHLDP